MLSSRFLRSDHGRTHGRMYNATEHFYDNVLGAGRYERGLSWVMDRRPLTLLFFRDHLLLATGWLFWTTPKATLPDRRYRPA